MKVSAIQCQYIKRPNTIARLIMFFQKTNFSHYAIKVEYAGTLYFYDSTGLGVRKSSPASFAKSYKEIGSFSTNVISYINFERFFLKHELKKYGFGQVIGILLKCLHIVKKNPFGQGAKRIICNELVILMLNEFNFTNVKDTDSLDLNDTTKLLKRVFK